MVRPLSVNQERVLRALREAGVDLAANELPDVPVRMRALNTLIDRGLVERYFDAWGRIDLFRLTEKGWEHDAARA